MLIGIGTLLYHLQNWIARILGGAEFYAQLTKSLALNRGTGTATITRATAKTFTDHEGVLRTAPAGCAAFTGSRFVRNLFVTTTADLSNAAWSKTNISVTVGQTDPDGGTTAMKLVEASGASVIPQISQSGNCVSGNTTLLWVIAKAAERNWLIVNNNQGSGGGSIRAWFNLTTGTVGTVMAGGAATIESLGDGWYLCAVKAVMSNGSNCGHIFQVSNADNVNTYAGDGTSGLYIWHPQLEDVTGRTDQTTPSEYVSVGVLSAPYHGAGIDGAEFFDTDLDGNPLTTLDGISIEGAGTNLAFPSEDLSDAGWTKNACTISANATTGPDGATTSDKIVETAASASHYVNKILANSAGVVTLSWSLKKGERDWGWIYIEAAATAVAYFNLNTGTVGTVSGTGSPSATITPEANGSYRCTLTATVGANANVGCGTATADNTISHAGDITKGIYAVMVDAKAGAIPSSYIPTTTTSAARNLDLEATPTTSNVAAAASSVALEYTPLHAPSGTVFLWATYVDADNYTAILHDGTNLIMRKRIAASNYDATIANAFVAGTTYKALGTWGAGGVTITLNGTEGTPHANTTAAHIGSTMQTGGDGNGANQAGMSFKNVRIAQRQYSASERLAVTA